MPAPPAGMIVADGVIVVGGEPGRGPHHVYRVTFDGHVEDLAAMPDTLFLNGFTPGPKGVGFAVDSILGAVIAIDLATGDSRVVLRDELLTKISNEPMVPDANGIKVGDDGLYVTNTDRALILRAPLDASGMPVGTVDVVTDGLRGDDLAVAENGDLFITTHIQNSVIRLATDGTRVRREATSQRARRSRRSPHHRLEPSFGRGDRRGLPAGSDRVEGLMGRYLIECTIDQSLLERLLALRAEHYEFLIEYRDHLVFGGPVRGTKTGPPLAMVMVVEAATIEEAQLFIAGEPYNRAASSRR